MVIRRQKQVITYGTKEQQLWALVSVLQQFLGFLKLLFQTGADGYV